MLRKATFVLQFDCTTVLKTLFFIYKKVIIGVSFFLFFLKKKKENNSKKSGTEVPSTASKVFYKGSLTPSPEGQKKRESA
jgi:hypothetical protein